MKYFLHGISFLLAFQISCAYGQISALQENDMDTITFSRWENGAWKKQEKIYNKFNTDCTVDSSISQYWNGNVWQTTSINKFTYYPSKKVESSIVSNRIGGTWTPYLRTTSTYNESLELIRELFETNYGGGLMVQRESVYSYDSRGFLIKELQRIWTGTEFKNAYQTDYENNASGVVTSERTGEWNDGVLENGDSSSYILNSKNQIKFAFYFDWEVDKWVNNSRSTGTFSGELLSVVTDEYWENDQWFADERFTLTYDEKNRINSITNERWDEDESKWVNSALSEISYTTSCTALPLGLLSFEVRSSSGAILLNWSTTNEINTLGFDIERSTDGINFQIVGTVPSKGNLVLNKYSFQDKQGSDLPGILYYRLRMTDVNGQFSLSAVEKVTPIPGTKVSLFPNPVRNQLQFVTGENMHHATINITGQDGRLFLTKKFANIRKSDQNTIDVSALRTGLYILRITDKDHKVRTEKFIKQ